MNNYVDKIHELIERLSPQLYVDVRYAHQMEYYKWSFVILMTGCGLLFVAWLLSKFTKIEGDLIVRVGVGIIIYSVMMLLSVVSTHK